MDIVNPDPALFVLPPGATIQPNSEDQPEYQTLPAIVLPDGRIVSQWRPTEDELKALFAGAPVTLVVWTFRQPLQPVALVVGGADLTV